MKRSSSFVRVLAVPLAAVVTGQVLGATPRDPAGAPRGSSVSASRLVAGPANHLNDELSDGGVAADALIEGIWLDPQGNAGGGAYPAGTSGVGTNHLTLPGARNITSLGEPLWLGLYFSNWGPQSVFGLKGMQASVDQAGWTGGLVPLPSCLWRAGRLHERAGHGRGFDLHGRDVRGRVRRRGPPRLPRHGCTGLQQQPGLRCEHHRRSPC